MTRTIADLTDDEIVDAIASFGVEGTNVHSPYFAARFGGIRFDDAFAERIERLWGDVRVHWIHDRTIGLSFAEWGRRLARRSAEDIARMLAGEA